MSVFGGPLINQSGMTLLLDAANARSYPGSGSTWNDISGNANDCSLINSPTYSNDYFSFNGSSQYGICANAPLNTVEYTKSVWFNLSSYATNNNLISGFDGSGGHFMFFATTNTLYCGHANWGGYLAYPSTATFNLDTWYHACLTFNTTDGFVLYINGSQDSTYTAQKTAATSGYVEIASFGNGNLFSGKIAMASIYNRTLSENEVGDIFQSYRGRFL